MKKILLFCFPLFIIQQNYAQDQRLFDNPWFLTEIHVGGQVIPAPLNGEVVNILLDLENLSPPNQDFQTQVCGFLAGNASYSTSQPEFSISGLTQSNVTCDETDNNNFQQQYYDIYLDNNSDPYQYSIIDNGDLQLIITAANGDEMVYANIALSVPDVELLQVRVTPNPVSERLFINAPSIRLEKFAVYNLIGQRLIEHINNDDSLFVGNLPSGIYFIEISTQTGNVIKKFIKE